MRWQPKLSSLAVTCAMSQGARNWPFLTLMARTDLRSARTVDRPRSRCLPPAPCAAGPPSDESGLVERGLHKGREQGVRRERARFQLGMELHADEPGMSGQLDDLR